MENPAEPQRSAEDLYGRATLTVETIQKGLPDQLRHPKIAIVCGSGLGGLAETIEPEPKSEIAYSDVPGFPVSTGKESKKISYEKICTLRPVTVVQGHAGKLVFGLMGKSRTPVVLLV